MPGKIKTAVLSVLIAAAAVFPSGCTVMPADITELESPPKLTAEQQAIERALEDHAGNKLTLKFPQEGDYRSAFVFRDFDHTGAAQALAFYSPSGNNTSAPRIAVLDKVNNKWTLVHDLGSEGNEIDSIEFGDFNGDGHDDIAVGWRTFSSTDLTLMVYMRKDGGFVKTNLGTFTEMKTLDMDDDGKTDILMLKLDSNVTQTSARLFSYRAGKMMEVSKTPLDSTVTSYTGVYITKLSGNKKGVLIDGVKGENKYITELILYENGRLVSPLYDPVKHTVNKTMRYVSYKCTDIDGDGAYEVPIAVELPEAGDDKSKRNWLVRWSVFDAAGKMTQKLSCVMNYNENYYFIYPEKWDGKVTVTKQVDDNVWNFCEWNASSNSYGKVLFSICVFNEETWNTMLDKKPFSLLSEKNGTVYAYTVPDEKANEKLMLRDSDIRKNFKLLY